MVIGTGRTPTSHVRPLSRAVLRALRGSDAGPSAQRGPETDPHAFPFRAVLTVRSPSRARAVSVRRACVRLCRPFTVRYLTVLFRLQPPRRGGWESERTLARSHSMNAHTTARTSTILTEKRQIPTARTRRATGVHKPLHGGLHALCTHGARRARTACPTDCDRGAVRPTWTRNGPPPFHLEPF